MKKTYLRLVPVILTIFLLISCGSDKQSSQGQQGQGYKDTKTMVLDVLKSPDGQKAIQESDKTVQDKTVKLLATGEGQQIQIAVKEIFAEPSGSKMLEKTMTDPKFAGQFAKAIEKSNKQIHKDLMKDPEYQKSMLETMNNPEYQKMITTAMKNTVYRQQMMSVIQESMQSPLFKMQLMELLKKVVQEGVTPKVEAASEKGGGDTKDQKGGDQKGKGGGDEEKDKKKDKGSDSDSDEGKDKKDKDSQE